MSSRLALLWLLPAGITLGLLLRPAEASPGATERVSVDSQGIEANGQSTGPSISTDGRYVAFTSSASNLVDGDNAEFTTYHAFLKDLVTGEVRRISSGRGVDSANVVHTAISDDGRFVAFNAPGGAMVYDRNAGEFLGVGGLVGDMSGDGRFLAVAGFASHLRDLTTGDSEPLPAGSRAASLSYDGRFVAHIDSEGRVAVLGRETGATEIVGVNDAGEAIGLNSWPSISNDGRYVAFQSQAPNIVAGDTLDTPDIFVRDRLAGKTILISKDANGLPSGGVLPQISANGRRIVYTSSYFAVKGRLLLHDLDTGITEKVGVNSLGEEANDSVPGVSQAPQDVSGDGRFIVFESNATNLVPDDTNGTTDIFVHDRGPQAEAPAPPPFEPPAASPSPEPTASSTEAPCASSTPTSSPSPEATHPAEAPTNSSSIPSAAAPVDASLYPPSPQASEESATAPATVSTGPTTSPEPTSCADAPAENEVQPMKKSLSTSGGWPESRRWRPARRSA
jgi:WD40-like Beta Propeller Repeat